MCAAIINRKLLFTRLKMKTPDISTRGLTESLIWLRAYSSI
jgi:hypothetical protein